MLLKRLVHEFLFQTIVGVGVTAAVTASAVLAKIWTWPNAIVGSVLLLSGLLYLLDRLGVGPTTRSRVRDWLDESGFGIQNHNDANVIHFVVIDNVGMYTHIVQAKHGDPISVYVPSLKPSDQQLMSFNALTPAQQQAIWKKIRLELLRAQAQFSDLKMDGEGVTLATHVAMSRDLTGTEFLRNLVSVRSVGRLYLELLNEHIP